MDSLRLWSYRRIGCNRTFAIEHRMRKLLGKLKRPFQKIEKPIFIWGPGRSGSYLVYDVLSLHPSLVCLRGRSRLNKGLYGDHHYGGGEHNYLLHNPFPPIEGFKRFFLRMFPDLREHRSLEEVDVKKVYVAYAEFAAGYVGKSRLLDKAPWYTYMIDLIDSIFPDAQHIRCNRHPIACAQSYYRRMCEPGALDNRGFWGWRPHGWEEFEHRPLEDRATWLAISVLRAAQENQKRLGERCLTVNYEDFVTNPHDEMTRLTRFLELPSWQGRLDEMPHSFPNYNRADGIPTANAELRQNITDLCNELGYDKSP
jgi:hypothetical protein